MKSVQFLSEYLIKAVGQPVSKQQVEANLQNGPQPGLPGPRWNQLNKSHRPSGSNLEQQNLNFFYWSFQFGWGSQVRNDVLVIAQTSPGSARRKSRTVLLSITTLVSELKPGVFQGQGSIDGSFN